MSSAGLRPEGVPGARVRLRVLGLSVACWLWCVSAAMPAQAAARASNEKAQPKGGGAKTAKGKRLAKGGKAAGGRKGGSRAAAGDSSTFLFQRPANVVANQQGKVVVFTFRNDDGDLLATQVGQLLEARGLEVMTGVRPVDSAEQYRDVATHLGLAAFVDGELRGSDAKARATVRLRSGYTGRSVAQAVFADSRANLAREISDKLWKRLGPAVARACADADKPRKVSRNTLQINAGTPIETIPNGAPAQGTTHSSRK